MSTLPAELLYRVLDFLDIQTILLSLRYVSKTFYAISDTYNSYHFDLSRAPKRDYDVITRLIRPENVLALTLSDDDRTPGQIGLFTARFRMHDLPRLRSLTLRHIGSKDLHNILNDLVRCSLTSLTITSTGQRSRSTLRLLSLLIARPHLDALSLNTHAHHIEGMFEGVTKSHLTRLSVGILTFNEYQSVLRHCPHLRTLTIDDCWMKDSESSSSTRAYRQVKCLTLSDTNRSMAQLEVLLALTPSLLNLQLINSSSTPNSLIDGLRWETLIKTKLAVLGNFQFVFYLLHLRIYDCQADVEPLIRSFRTPFWIEEKRWFTLCQSIKNSHTVQLFSVPFPTDSFECHFDPGNILVSTIEKKLHQHSVMDHVRCLSLNLSEVRTTGILRQDFLFHHVIELKLQMHGEFPSDALRFISMLVNMSQLQSLSFRSDFNRRTLTKTIDGLATLLKQTTNLRSFVVLPFDANGQSGIDLTTFCAPLPAHIEHLTWRVQTAEDMEFVLSKLTWLSSVTFHLPGDRKINCDNMLHGRQCSYLLKDSSLHLWLFTTLANTTTEQHRVYFQYANLHSTGTH